MNNYDTILIQKQPLYARVKVAKWQQKAGKIQGFYARVRARAEYRLERLGKPLRVLFCSPAPGALLPFALHDSGGVYGGYCP